jgi:para-nitrobenzyl esterase
MTMSRRELLLRTSATALLLSDATRSHLFGASGSVADSTVETAYGKVRGRSIAGIHSFLGLRYGASTSGRNRFMAPEKPQPWTGIQDAFSYGNSAPQTNPARSGSDLLRSDIGRLVGGTDGVPPPESEDCLFLNVWTPGVNDNGKRPVMFWLRGCGGDQPSSGRAGFHALG